MAKFCPLFSGSSGNCTYIGDGGEGILVDAGVSAKRIETALLSRDISPKSISGLFVTHEHTDHIAGVKVLVKRYGYKVYGSVGTRDALVDRGDISDENFHVIQCDGVHTNSMHVKSFAISHDCREPVGFQISTSDGRKIAIATDTGEITDEIRENLAGSDLVMLESNYDNAMLESGPYPYFLKRRIQSKTGHLSNESCSGELISLLSSGTTRFFLAHLSKDNNYPDLAYQTAVANFHKYKMRENVDYMLSVAPRTDSAQVMIL